MTEGLLIAIIGLAGAVLAALIGAFGAIAAAGIKGKKEGEGTDSEVSCGIVGLAASVMGAVGLVLGVLFGAFVVQTTGMEFQPTAAITATSRPVAPPAATATTIVSLKYDETGGIQFAQGQTQLVAVYLQKVQAGDSLEEAIQSIKQQAANARSTVQEGNSISIESLQAYLVWCPNADCIYPTNTAFPLEGFRQDYLKVAVIEVGESRVVQCPSYCWAVAVR